MTTSSADFGARRRALVRQLMLRPATLFPMVGLPVPLAIAGQEIGGSGGVAVGAGLAVPLGLAAWRFTQATNQAEDTMMGEWGASHGLTFAEEVDLPGDAPLLRAGDRRRAENGLFDLHDVARGLVVCHYTYIDDRRGSNGRRRSESHRFTVCHLTLDGTGWSSLPRVQLHRRGPLEPRFGDRIESALTPERVVELESVEFNDAFKLKVSDAQDELAVRAFFTPAFIVWLLEGAPPGFMFEMELNTLVAALPGRVRDPELLDGLLAGTRQVAGHVERSHAYEEMTSR